MPAVHSTSLELIEPVPPEVPVGSDILLKLKVSCEAGCDLRGAALTVTGGDGGPVASRATPGADEENETIALTIKAPPRPGAYTWTIALAAHEQDGIVHEAAVLPVHVQTIPQTTSLAVWSIPPFAVMGERFAIRVGAKSSADCELSGETIEVSDDTGAVVARGTLGDEPWPDTRALYWTQVEVPAPSKEGICSWSVRFAAPELELVHDGAAAGFSFVVARPPEHTLTVKVVEKETAAPIDNVQIRVGCYRGATDESGRADVRISKGIYDLNVWKVGYEAPAKTIEVSADAVVEVEVLTVPEDDPDAVWLM